MLRDLKAMCALNKNLHFDFAELEVSEIGSMVENVFLVSFFSQKNGLEKNLGFGKLSDYEQKLLTEAMGELKGNIAKGEEFVKGNQKASVQYHSANYIKSTVSLRALYTRALYR